MAQAYTELAGLRTIRNPRPDWPDILGQEVVSAKDLYIVGHLGQSDQPFAGMVAGIPSCKKTPKELLIPMAALKRKRCEGIGGMGGGRHWR